MSGVLTVISGSAGAGKGTVIAELFKLSGQYKKSVSATTRVPREGEREGVNYFFKTRDEFENLIANNELIEYTEYSGNLYGTPKSGVETALNEGYNVIFEIEVEGAMNIKRLYGDALLIFISPPTYKELEYRLKNRGTESCAAIANRLARAKEEIEYMKEYDYFVINETNRYKESAEIINEIINTARKYKTIQSNVEKFIRSYYS